MDGKVVVVTWDDAHYNSDEAEIGEIVHRPWKYTSCGILVQSDEVGVTLAMDKGEDGRYRGRTFIPRRMVVEEQIVPMMVKRPKRKANIPIPQSIPDIPNE